jgi:dynein assembly factor 1
MSTMTIDMLSSLCKERGLFRTPELNEKLYLHFCGFKRIENLGAYSECRALWLENNSIEYVENLESLENLETLFIQHNFISSLRFTDSTQLTSPPLHVRCLDISYNFLTTMEDIPLVFPLLQKLLVSHNRIKNLPSNLGSLQHLIVLDVSFNEIDNVEGGAHVLSALGGVPCLSSLMMQGNSVTKIQHYRKRLIAQNESLTFLDEYPVFPEERRCCNAFVEGGKAAESKVKAELAAEQITEKEKQLQFFADVRSSIIKNLTGSAPATTKYFLEHDEERSLKSHEAVSPSTKYVCAATAHKDPTSVTTFKKPMASIVTISDDEDEEM